MRPVLIVSGASSSLGIVLCRKLIENGYKVYAGYNSNREKLSQIEHLLPFKLDITNTSECKRAILTVVKKEKKIFGLINLVAISPSGKTNSFEVSDFQKILDINTVGPFRLIKEVLPFIAVSGKIINIGSLSGLISFPNFSLYSASKFALRAMSLSLYFEWLPLKRFIIHIAPGAIAKDPPVLPPPGSARGRIPLLNWVLPLVSAEKVSQTIINCLKNPSPPPEILVGVDTVALTLIRRISPEYIWSKIQKFVWRKQQ